jgi:hypothetical protein
VKQVIIAVDTKVSMSGLFVLNKENNVIFAESCRLLVIVFKISSEGMVAAI